MSSTFRLVETRYTRAGIFPAGIGLIGLVAVIVVVAMLGLTLDLSLGSTGVQTHDTPADAGPAD